MTVTKTVVPPAKRSRKRKQPETPAPPEGVVIVGLDDPRELHHVIAEAVNEPAVVIEQPDEPVVILREIEPVKAEPTAEPTATAETVKVTLDGVRETKRYLVVRGDGAAEKWLEKAKMLAWRLDDVSADLRNGRAEIELSAKQARIWKLGA